MSETQRSAEEEEERGEQEREMRTLSLLFKNTTKLRDWSPLLLPSSSSSSSAAALFHSTTVPLASHVSKDGGRSDEPKTHIRYSVRQKRADAKGTLKNLLLNGTPSKQHFQDEDNAWCGERKNGRKLRVEESSHESKKLQRSKKTGKLKHHNLSNNGKGKRNKKQSWQNFYDEDDYDPPKTKSSASHGERRCFTWSFGSGENLHFESYTAGFEWREDSEQAKTRKRIWSESDTEEESIDRGLQPHRVTLGLPLTGPLTLDEVKCAFHKSAFKWHPDKHPGPSQTIAEEKFKLCVDAYNSLCNSLKSKLR